MDVISHGLWGGIAGGRKSRFDWWAAFAIGVAPDVLSFGILWVLTWLGFNGGPDWRQDHWNPALIPSYVHQLYNITHSGIVFALVFGIVWEVRRVPYVPLVAWGLHILMDIPTHTERFFPTPFLWPISDVTISGISWSHPAIFIPNIIALVALYTWWIAKKGKRGL